MYKKRGDYVHFNEKAYNVLENYLLHQVDSIKNIFILIDDITYTHCLPILFQKIDFLKKSNLIQIKSGEKEKNIDTCIQICKSLEKFKATRKSLILNLGGGVITDIGGFVASIFKRGIRFINIPTTLLGMVDAAIGYKTGVNLDSIKNEIGSFYIPEFLIIDTHFLKTLPNEEIFSGMAEMLKHGLIADKNFWKQMNQIQKNIIQDENQWTHLIQKSILIKQKIVDQDPKEKGLRKILNFGHTIGHALESYFMNINKILHGVAVTMGMIYESWISYKINGLSISDYKEIKYALSTLCPINKISDLEFQKLLLIMEHDKKNEKNKIQFSLLKEIGKCSYNCSVPYPLIKESFLN
ncbi:3-dehydroquinate synthase [Blattabacterium sp. DPU]|uniref:3-dehydroquinate synthase n=1 Tax=Blattabacterium sp. DPU TaxID=2715232 RepID=UPI00140D8E8F|nr:3-dehydroquinate synthase [Blattabacterium sp. DPU]QIK16832.1 3-dehydroquinate synthase [Blattabacterium sp. DPU]